MNEAEILEVFRQAILVTLTIAAPTMLIGLLVGLLVSLFQALTQIQEMTLAFVPKILAIFGALALLMPWMIGQLTTFYERLADRIVSLG